MTEVTGMVPLDGIGGRRQIHLIGFMGSGKSTVGRLVARRLVWNFLDLDVLIERHAGRSIAAIFAADGEAGFRELESFVLRQAVQKPQAVVALGGGTPIDPVNWSVSSRAAITVWLRCPLPVMLGRVADTGERPLWLERQQLQRLLAAREPQYGRCDHTVDATAAPELVAELIETLVRVPADD